MATKLRDPGQELSWKLRIKTVSVMMFRTVANAKGWSRKNRSENLDECEGRE